MNTTALPQGFTLVQADTVVPQAWRNGGSQTRELLAWPEGQDWRLRISRADIAADGPFSAFAGIDRWFTVLEGAGVALHFSGAPGMTVTLRLGDAPLHFDGALAPGCSLLNGATQDLNLMARAGRSTMQRVQTNAPWSPSFAINGIYTATAGVFKTSDETSLEIPLPAHSLLYCTAPHSSTWSFTPDTKDLRAFWLGYTPDTP
jgi:environmental stress-induced protein Ves